jgi:long-chain acyl-CoA synthetase
VRAHLSSLVEDFRKHSAETAVVAHRGNRRYATSYGQLANLAGRFAAELERRGIVSGDRVVLWGENSAEWIAAFFGCLLRGVIAVPLDAAGASEFAARVTTDVAAKLVVGDSELIETLALPRRGVEYAGANGEADPGSATIPRLAFSHLQASLPGQPLFTVAPEVGQQTPFQIVFTSGTTSEPRGIVHTHRNILVTLEPIEREIAKYRRYERWVHPLRFLHTLPLSHVFGQFMGLWIPAVLGAELHFAERFEPARMVDLIRRERISVLIAVPRIQQLLRAHLLTRFPGLAAELDAAAELSLWKRWWRLRQVHRVLGWKFWAVISGGATLPPELESFWNRLGVALIQGYGMTETSALVTLNHPFHRVQGSIGKPLPGREVKIGDDGEILVRGEMLAGATWQGGTMHRREGEWLATGDLAERNASGELRFLGRKGDLIVTGAGMNVHPADLETAMLRQPGVRQCVVVPCEFAGGAEAVAVVIFSNDEQALQAAVTGANRSLAEFQQIRRVLRWPELQFPHTTTGKLIRRQVAQWACQQLLGDRAAKHAAPAGDLLLALIAEVTGEPVRDSLERTGDPEPHRDPGLDRLRLSEDLHVDSLGRVQLQAAIEQRLGVEIDEDAMAAVQTVAALRWLVERNLKAGVDEGAAARNSETRVAGATSSPEAEPDKKTIEQSSYPRWPWSWPVHALRVAFIEVVLRPMVWLLAAPRVARESASPPQGPLLVIANHVTAYDAALVLYALPPKLRRRVAVAMSGEILLDLRRGRNQANAFENLLAPIGYWLITALFNVFPLPRARGFRRSFAHAGDAMDRGYSVLIFPEGTRSRDGRLHGFRPGIGLLGQQSGVPVLPVALVGLHELRAVREKRGRGRWFRSGRLAVHVGTLVPVDRNADPAQLTASLEQALRALYSTAAKNA